jgi:hypothetical protein
MTVKAASCAELSFRGTCHYLQHATGLSMRISFRIYKHTDHNIANNAMFCMKFWFCLAVREALIAAIYEAAN